MVSASKCPQCGRPLRPDAPAGLCLTCLARLGADGPAPLPADCLPAPPSPASATIRYFGDYELLAELGRGGMGIVYTARQVSLDRLVAVKLLTQEHLAKPEFRRRFQQESKLAARLKHPNIVAIHEAGEHDGQPFFSMEYVLGTDLAKLVAGMKLIPERRAAGYLQTVALALHYAHEQGVIHRDLKPSNILIGPEDQPRITDFGLARLLEPGTSLTLAGDRLGTPEFMAPEQAFAGLGNTGVHSDVYGLGAVLYFLLAGRPPLVANSLGDLLHAVRDQTPEPPSHFNPAVSPALDSLCLWCLAKRPSHRPISALAVATELAAWLATPPDRSQRLSGWQRVHNWSRRLPKPAAAGMAAATVLAAAALFVFWLGVRGKVDRDRNPPAVASEPDDPGAPYGLQLSPPQRQSLASRKQVAAQDLATNLFRGAWMTNWTWDYPGRLAPVAPPEWPVHPEAVMLAPPYAWHGKLHQIVVVPVKGVPALRLSAKAGDDCFLAVLVNGVRVWQTELDTCGTNLLLDLRQWAGQRVPIEIVHTTGGPRNIWYFEAAYLDQASVVTLPKPPPELVAPSAIANTQTNGWWHGWTITNDRYAQEDGGSPRIAPLLDGRPYVLFTHPISPEEPCFIERRCRLPAGAPSLRLTVRADSDFVLRVWVDDSLVASNVISHVGWTRQEFDLSPWAGTERRLRLDHSGGGPLAAWAFEGALWADISITNGTALGRRSGGSAERH